MSEYVYASDGKPMASESGKVSLAREEIVRCRDCKHYTDHEWVILTDVYDVCHFWHGELTAVKPDGFCAWGERK